jgi:integrase
MKLTSRAIDALVLQSGESERIAFDDDIPGFGIRLRAGGSRSWVFQYKIGKQHRRLTMGKVAAISAAKARDRAGDLHAQVRLGIDPAAVKAEGRQRAAETFKPIMERFLARQKARLRPGSYREVMRHLTSYAKPLHSLPFAVIERRTVADLLSRIAGSSGQVAANRARASLSAFFAWAIGEGITTSNPVIGTNKAVAEVTRDRVLSEAEILEIWLALRDDDYGDIFRMLLLTGQRRQEIGGLLWSEIDFERRLIVLPGARTKNAREHLVPMSNEVRDILAGRTRVAGRDPVFGRAACGFRDFHGGKKVLDKKLSLAPWHLHDVRRSVATHMAENGVQPHVIEAVLNHASGHKGGVAGVYNRATYTAEKAAALTLWADHLRSIINGTSRKVVPLRGRAD